MSILLHSILNSNQAEVKAYCWTAVESISLVEAIDTDCWCQWMLSFVTVIVADSSRRLTLAMAKRLTFANGVPLV